MWQAIAASAAVGVVAGVLGSGEQVDAAEEAAGLTQEGIEQTQKYGRKISDIVDRDIGLGELSRTAVRGLRDEIGKGEEDFSEQYYQDVSEDVRKTKFALSASGKRGSGEAGRAFSDIVLSRGQEEYNRRYGLDLSAVNLGLGAREGVARAGQRTIGNISGLYGSASTAAGGVATAEGALTASRYGLGSQAIQAGINTYVASV